MKRKFVSALCLAAVLLAAALVPATALADGHIPTVAILSYRNAQGVSSRLIHAVYDVLHYHGYLSSEEVESIVANEDFAGENINIIWRDAGGDISNVPIMTDYALDKGATVMVTTTTNVTLNAIHAAEESGIEPTPLVIFSLVGAPYTSGVADAPCVKPEHVVGSHALSSYEDVMALLPMQNPEIDFIGSFMNPGNSGHVYATEQIKHYAEALGITVEEAPWLDAADGLVNAERLIDSDVDMFVSLGHPPSLPAIIEASNEAGIPILATAMSYVHRGVHIAAGFYSYYNEGAVVGHMLTAALDGELDAGRVGIHAAPRLAVALNLDSIKAGGIKISDALMERADFVVENGESTEEFTKPEYPDVDMEERHAERSAFLVSLRCTDEMIEEQRAALEAEA